MLNLIMKVKYKYFRVSQKRLEKKVYQQKLMRTDERESVRKSKKMQQILQADEFLLVMILNVILLTIGLNIFNVCFLLIFITSALKFYKTNIM
jgi:hypothetical protein